MILTIEELKVGMVLKSYNEESCVVIVNTDDQNDEEWAVVWVVDEDEYDANTGLVVDIESFDSLKPIDESDLDWFYEYTGKNRGTKEMDYIYVE